MLVPCIVDIEASGFGYGSYPIEVGFVTSDTKAHCALIKPFDYWTHWDQDAELLHGISRATLAAHGKSPYFICQWLNERLSGQTIYSDAWANDMSWLGRLFDECGMQQAFRIESLLVLLSPYEQERWSKVLERVSNSSKKIRHRASVDASLIQKAFIEIRRDGSQSEYVSNHGSG